jgi:hypothetical protein
MRKHGYEMQYKARTHASDLLAKHYVEVHQRRRVKHHGMTSVAWDTLVSRNSWFQSESNEEGPLYLLIPPILLRRGTGRVNNVFLNPTHGKQYSGFVLRILAMLLLGAGR